VLRVLGTGRAQDRLFGFALFAPALVFFLLLVVGPVVETLATSVLRKDLTRPELGTPFVGFANYANLLSLSTFWSTVGNSVILAGSSTAIQIVLGLAIALLLNEKFHFRLLVRAAILLPWAMPTIVAAFVFRWLFDTSFGPVNAALDALGLIHEPIAWLGSSSTALPTVIAAHVWKGVPFVVLVFLAALQALARELHEAARVDGAGYWSELWYVTLPQLRYVISLVFVLRFIWTFNWFDLTYLLTGGGPGSATMTLPIQVYITAFRTYQLGLSSAYATVIAVVLLAFAVLFMRLANRERAQ
jgi:ABC-type sugar transport system permease subunit